MVQNKEKIEELFYENPEKAFTVREISKITKIPKSSVYRQIVKLRKEGIIDKENRLVYSLLVKIKKANHISEKIVSLGLIEKIVSEMNPSCIILFGSARKGEYDKDSDIDIFIETSLKKDIKLNKFEKNLGHAIQLFIEKDINDLPKHLFNNIINGIKLYGSFKIR